MATRIASIINFIQNFVSKGQERSVKAKQNIIFSFLIRGSSIGIGLLLVPLTINYVNASQYGIWLTLSSIVAWFSFFDIGLTQGLRNKFVEAKANGDDERARIYVSTTYAILILIFGLVWLLFLLVNNFLNWGDILNINSNLEGEISALAIIVFSYFCLQFVLKVITTLIIADQQPAKSSFIDLLGQVFSLIFISILVITSDGSLIKLGIALCSSPILILIAANIFYFRGEYKKYRPSFSKIRFTYAKALFNLGVVFFIIQVAGIIQYETANFIIARKYGTADVTSYNIVYKYFGMLNMVYMIFITPFWSASTEAFMKKDFQWIKNSMKRYTQLNIVLFIIGILMLLVSSVIYDLWLGKGTVSIGFNLSLWGCIYFSTVIFINKYVYFLNGINALRLQFISCLISPVIFVTTAFVLIDNYHLGVHSLFIASVAANLIGLFLAPIQYSMIVNKRKQGIWLR